MKKLVAIILVTVLALSMLTACGGGILGGILGDKDDEESAAAVLTALLEKAESASSSLDSSTSSSGTSSSSTPSSSTSSSSKTDSDSGFSIGKDEIKSNIKGDFSITYKVYTSSSDKSADMIFIRTSDGYYFDMKEYKYLYIKNGDMYDVYFPSDEGFFKVDFLEPQPEDAAASAFGALYDLMTTHIGKKDLKKDGDETVAGRSCDRYKESAVGFGVAFGGTYCIDKETGACLKFQYDMAVEGGMGSATFECVEYLTSGVKLPDYK